LLAMAPYHREIDSCRIPSSQIILGQPPQLVGESLKFSQYEIQM
jgi:hypothetical protein